MSSQLATTQPAQMQIAQPQEQSIGTVIQWAMQNNATVEQMRELYAFQREVKADQAREAFNRAFTAFKGEDIRIIKDKENAQYSKGDRKAMYSSLENMVAVVTPFLSKHDLSASWSTPSQTPGSMTVSCTITHILGHSRSETVTGPMDESGAKNKLQQVKSTTTYLKTITFESVCGLASSLGNLSDDGNASGGTERLPEDEIRERVEHIRGSNSTAEVEKFYLLAIAAAEKLEDRESAKIFTAEKKRKLRDFRSGE